MYQPERPLYLDSAATTRVAPEVCATMLPYLDGSEGFANPSSGQHIAGRDAAAVIEQARAQVAGELHCASDEIIFTSGATESINLALQGSLVPTPGTVATSSQQGLSTRPLSLAAMR